MPYIKNKTIAVCSISERAVLSPITNKNFSRSQRKRKLSSKFKQAASPQKKPKKPLVLDQRIFNLKWLTFILRPDKILEHKEGYVYVPLKGSMNSFVSINFQMSKPKSSLPEALPVEIQRNRPKFKLECSVYNSSGDVSKICDLYLYDKKGSKSAYITNVHAQEDVQLYTSSEVKSRVLEAFRGTDIMTFAENIVTQLGCSKLFLQDATEIRFLDEGKPTMTKMMTPLLLAGKDHGYYGRFGFEIIVEPAAQDKRAALLSVLRSMPLACFKLQLKKSVDLALEKLDGSRKRRSNFYSPQRAFQDVVDHYHRQGQTSTTVQELFHYYQTHRKTYPDIHFKLCSTVHPKEMVVGYKGKIEEAHPGHIKEESLLERLQQYNLFQKEL